MIVKFETGLFWIKKRKPKIVNDPCQDCSIRRTHACFGEKKEDYLKIYNQVNNNFEKKENCGYELSFEKISNLEKRF